MYVALCGFYLLLVCDGGSDVFVDYDDCCYICCYDLGLKQRDYGVSDTVLVGVRHDDLHGVQPVFVDEHDAHAVFALDSLGDHGGDIGYGDFEASEDELDGVEQGCES